MTIPIRSGDVQVFAESVDELSAHCSLPDAQQPSLSAHCSLSDAQQSPQGEALLQVGLQRTAPHQQHDDVTKMSPGDDNDNNESEMAEEEEHVDFSNSLKH